MKKILAIDDQKDNLTTIKAILRNNITDCKVLTAISGKEGIEIARKEQPDTILLDIIMPEMDGYEVCNKLKEDVLTTHIPVVMLTAIKTDTKSRVKGLEAGADAFISKPYEPAELVAQIKVMLRIKQAEDDLRAEKEFLDKKVNERTKELIESDRLLKSIFDDPKTFIGILELDGSLIMANKAALKFINSSNSELKGIKFWETPWWKHSKELQEKLKAGIAKTSKGEIVRFEADHYGKNNNYIIVEFSMRPVKNSKDEIHRIIVEGLDINERKEAEKALLKIAESYRITSEKTGQLVYDYDPASSKVVWAGAIELITGFSFDEFQLVDVNGWSDMIHPDDREVILYELNKAEKACSNFDVDYRFLQKNGSYIYVEEHGVFLSDNEGKANRMLGSIKDITKRKRTEQIQKVLFNISNAVITTDNLKKLISLIQKELGTIIDTTNFYIAIYDKKTDTLSLPFLADEKDKIESFAAGKTMTGYVIKTQKSLLVSDTQQEKLVEKGDIKFVGSRSKIWLGVPLKVKHEVIGVLAVQSYSDKNAYNESDVKMLEFVSHQISLSIHRKKADENLLVALKKAKESDRLKIAFLNAMSHELRTPLNAVIGFSELIDEYANKDDILNFSKSINKSGNHLLEIIEDIFDVSLIETGELKIHKEKFEIAGFFKTFQKILETKQNSENKQNLEIRFKPCENHERMFVYSDIQRLKQLLTHLLKNALKFTHEGYIEYGFSKEIINNESMLKFFVKDTGVGVSKEKQEFIFEIFRQADDSDTRKYDGVGIGLSIAKQIAEFLGGKLWLESNEDKGSTFYFTIPYSKDNRIENVETSTETKKSNDFSGKTVLIVEDVESNFQYLNILLKKFNVKILWVMDGNSAIQVCSDNTDIDIVFMDIKMPGISGYEATKQIKKFRPSLPIIAQTAYALYGDDKKAENAGCDDYITKPFKRKIIDDIIFKYLDN